jgi:hypothetical protein
VIRPNRALAPTRRAASRSSAQHMPKNQNPTATNIATATAKAYASQ